MICGEAGGSPVRIASPNSIRDEERNVHELYSYEHNAWQSYCVRSIDDRENML
jgi:hypothetical protein